MINNTVNTKKLDLSNVGRPQKGITNLNLVPSYVREKPKAAPVAQAVQKPAAPLVKAPSSSAGSYQGVAINPGSDADVAAQMRKIDAARASGPQNVAPVKGLFNDVKSSVSRAKTPAPVLPPTFSGLVQDLRNRATAGDKAVQTATKNLGRFQQATADTLADIQSDAIPLEFKQGRAQVVQQASQVKEAALQQAVENALAAQQQDLTALTSAAGLVQPSVAAFGQTVFDPLNKGFVGGAAGAQPNVSSLAQQVVSGQLTPSQAESMLGNNLGLVSQLNQAVLGLNPSFDRVQAEAQAGARAADITQTGQAGGQVSKAAVSANQALDTLQQAYSGLSVFTGASDIPFVNQIAQNLALQTGFGREAVSAYQGALNEARAQLRSVLGSSGVNDLAAGGIVDTLLPEGMIPSEVPQKVAAAKDYIQKRVEALTQPGVVGGQQTGGGGAVQAGGFQFVQDASGKWVPAR